MYVYRFSPTNYYRAAAAEEEGAGREGARAVIIKVIIGDGVCVCAHTYRRGRDHRYPPCNEGAAGTPRYCAWSGQDARRTLGVANDDFQAGGANSRFPLTSNTSKCS